MRPSRFRADWLGLFALAFGIRLFAAVVLGGFRNPELMEYDDIARSLLAGRGFTYYHLGVLYQSFTTPLYVWLCAAIYWAGGTVSTVLVAQMLANAGHAVLVAALAERLFKARGAGLAAGLLMAVHPGFIVYASTKAHTLILDALSFTLVLWVFWRLSDRPSGARAVWAGVVVGLATLSRATAFIFLPVAGAWMLWTTTRDRWPVVAGRFTVATLCALAVTAPWTVRNTMKNGEFVWTLTTGGEDLWRGNNPHATGHSYKDADTLVLETLTPAERREVRSQPNEMAQSRWFTTRALNFITSEPRQFVVLTVKKFFYFWWFSPQTGMLYARSWLRAYQAYYILVLGLGTVGVAVVSRARDAEAHHRLALIVLFLLVLSGLQSLFYVEGRHRWAIEPLLLILAGGGAHWSVAGWRSHRSVS